VGPCFGLDFVEEMGFQNIKIDDNSNVAGSENYAQLGYSFPGPKKYSGSNFGDEPQNDENRVYGFGPAVFQTVEIEVFAKF